MRKISQTATANFWNTKRFSSGNTKVLVFENQQNDFKVSSLLLHDNEIATYNEKEKTLKIKDCGWTSNTSKERLNSILEQIGFYISQKNFQWYLIDVKDHTINEKWQGQKTFLL